MLNKCLIIQRWSFRIYTSEKIKHLLLYWLCNKANWKSSIMYCEGLMCWEINCVILRNLNLTDIYSQLIMFFSNANLFILIHEITNGNWLLTLAFIHYINRIIHGKICTACFITTRNKYQSSGPKVPRADIGRVVIQHAIQILPCIDMFIIYFTI